MFTIFQISWGRLEKEGMGCAAGCKVTSWADEESDEEWQTVNKKHERKPPEPSPRTAAFATASFGIHI